MSAACSPGTADNPGWGRPRIPESDDGAEFSRTFSCFRIRLSAQDTAIRRFDIVAQAILAFPILGAGDF